jgi:hypothetical protein
MGTETGALWIRRSHDNLGLLLLLLLLLLHSSSRRSTSEPPRFAAYHLFLTLHSQSLLFPNPEVKPYT